MEPVIDFLTKLGAWNWFVVAIAMLLLESVIPGIHFMWFGVAAVIVGAMVLAMQGTVAVSIPVQLIIFAVVAMLTILVARRFWSGNDTTTDVPDLNFRGNQYVGRIVTVEEPIASGRGKVRVGDTVWTAEGPDISAGTQVRVTGVNGTVLVVAPT